MQQAIYNKLHLPNTGIAPVPKTTAPRRANVLRWVSRKWDLVGVLAFMGASAAYGAYALAHLGL